MTTQPADDSADLALVVTLLSAQVVAVFQQAEVDLIASVASDARRGIAAPPGSAARLGMLRAMQGTARTVAARLRAQSEPLAAKAVTEAARRGNAQAIRTLTGLVTSHPSLLARLTRPQPEPVTPLALAAANRIQLDLTSRLASATYRITRFADDAYRAAVVRAAINEVLTGGPPAALQRAAWDDLMSRGVTGFTDTRGRQWNLASYVEMATRTAVQRAYNEAHQDRMTAAGVAEFTVAPHAHPCPLCQPWEGKVLTAETIPTARAAGLFHPNCFPAETLVASPAGVRAADSRWYEGDLVVIHTASGNEVSVTPNHPVLTPEGWVAAGLLTVGNRLLRYPVDVERVDGVGPHDQQVPAPIGDVFDALRQSSGMTTVTVPASAEQFHGDGEGSDVEVVLAHGLLQDHGIGAQVAHALGDCPLLTRGVGLADLFGGGALDKVGLATSHAPHSVVSGRSEGRTLLRGRAGHAGLGGLGSAPLGAALDDPAADAALTDAEGGRKLALSLASKVTLDEIVNIGTRKHSGHVYNLQTGNGWYVANGIVAHNCTHTLVAYFEGITRLEPSEWTQADQRQYDAAQHLRYLERRVRAAKLAQAGALDDLDKARARRKARAAQAAIRDHLAAHPSLLRRRRREQLNLGNG